MHRNKKINRLIVGIIACSMALTLGATAFECIGGEVRTAELAILVVLFLGQLIFLLATLRERPLQTIPIKDEVTGLYNLDKFKLDFTERVQTEDGLDNLLIVALDIDSFKMLNKQLGYDEGSAILRYVGCSLSELLQQGESCYHVRADLFYLLLQGRDPEYNRLRLRGKLDQLSCYFRDKHAQNVFFSCGIYPYEQSMLTAIGVEEENNLSVLQALDGMAYCLDNANMARERAKMRNSNSVIYYSSQMRGNEALTKRLEDAFLLAIEQGEFQVYYQPKYAMKNGEAVLAGAEALVRWNSEELGFMPPGSFIPTFTKDGNDVLLDMYMTEVVCRTIRDWLSEGYEVKPVSVNVSRNTTSNENDYLGCVRNMMGLHEIPKDLLEFEILETSSEQGEDQVVTFIDKFHQHGYKIAMDDFGTGYSTLGFLNRVHFDTLKLDKSFFDTWTPDMDPKGQAIVRNILRMAKELGITTVAEGVEEKYQVDALFEMGCDMIQGFYFSKPLPQEEFEKLLTKKKAS